MKKYPEFIAHLEQFLDNKPVLDITPVYGGHINKSYRLKTADASYFIKLNSSTHFPGMFATEAAGLRLLADSQTVSIPKVLARGQWQDLTYLLMEWIDPAEPAHPNTMELFGRQLADMHCHSSLYYGLSPAPSDVCDPFDHHLSVPHHEPLARVARLVQSNTPHDSWPEFFITEKLQPMLTLALEKGNLSPDDELNFQRLFLRIPALFPQEPPALLHGDLWKGNFIAGANGQPYLVDPAVYYGHREMDIAMTHFFKGFEETLYAAYNECYPLMPGWKERIDLCNLYPLLILTVLGPDYRDQLRRSLAKYL